MEILDQAVWININYRTWQGKKTLTRAEINKYSNLDELPPESLITPGSKSIANPDNLTKINSFGKKVARECEKLCLKVFGLYGTSAEASEELLQLLAKYKIQHTQMISDYLDSYETETDEWIMKHPKWEQWLRSSMLSRADIESKFTFEFQAFKLTSGGEGALMNDGLEKAEGGLLGTLLSEIEKMARLAWDTSFENRDKTSQKAIRPIRTILTKLDTLSFIDGKVLKLTKRVQDVLDALPKSGFIEGADLSSVCGALNLLCSSQRMSAFMQQNVSALAVLEEDLDDVEVEQRVVDDEAGLEAANVLPAILHEGDDNDAIELATISPLTTSQPRVQPAQVFGF